MNNSFDATHRESVAPATQSVQATFKSGCDVCDWWDESSKPDFRNCPICCEPKTVWNMTNAEAATDYELMLETQIA